MGIFYTNKERKRVDDLESEFRTLWQYFYSLSNETRSGITCKPMEYKSIVIKDPGKPVTAHDGPVPRQIGIVNAIKAIQEFLGIEFVVEPKTTDKMIVARKRKKK